MTSEDRPAPLPCRVGRQDARIALEQGRLVVEAAADGPTVFFPDETLRIEEKFGKDGVSVLLWQRSNRCQVRRLHRDDFIRLQEWLRREMRRPRPAEPPPAAAEDMEARESLWEEITASPGAGRIRSSTRRTVATLVPGADGDGASRRSSPAFREARLSFDVLGWLLAVGLFAYVAHSFWIGFASDPHGAVIRRALDGDRQAARQLASTLQDEEDLAARVAIVETLSLSGGPEVRSALIHALLQRDEPYYRRVTVQALVRLRVGEEVLAFLGTETTPLERRRRLVEDLGRYGSPQIIPVLQAAYGAVEPALRDAIVDALAQLGDFDLLLERARGADAGSALRAFDRLASLDPATARRLILGVAEKAECAEVRQRAQAWLRRHE